MTRDIALALAAVGNAHGYLAAIYYGEGTASDEACLIAVIEGLTAAANALGYDMVRREDEAITFATTEEGSR